MTSESKILTVSYGTFSCTLEGFDNPFDTMKAIAEYFRDLAAQDRHFGAEPPPPDAAMLHRLAEREVSRMVASGSREDTSLLQQPAAASQPEPVAPKIQLNTLARRPSHNPADLDLPVEDDVTATEPSLQDVIPDGVAAKLARIRMAVHPAPMAAPVTAFSPDLDTSSVEAEAETAFSMDGLVGDFTEAAPAEALAPAPDLTPEADASEDIAARLGALIEAEPETTDLPGYEDEDLAEPDLVSDIASDWSEEIAADEAPMADGLAAAFAEELEEDLADAAEADAEVVEAAVTEGEVIEAAVTEGEVIEAAVIEGDGTEADIEETEMADLSADLPPEDDTADMAELAALDGVSFDEASLSAALEDSLPEDEVSAEAEAASLSEAEAEDFIPESLAEEIEAEAAFAEAAFAEAPPALVEAPVEEEPAAAFAPLPPVEDEATSGSKARAKTRRLNSRVVKLHPEDGDQDSAATRAITAEAESDEIARLMQQAEEVMAEGENRRRQEALSRLKAAVVATEADRNSADYEEPKADLNLNPYRDDLAEAIQPPPLTEEPAAPSEVKPQRKTISVRPQDQQRPGMIRPGLISPPPLVLVSEQRIDRVPPATPPAPPPAAAPSMAPAIPGIGPANSDGQPMVALRTGRLSGMIGAGAAVASAGYPARNLVLEKPSYGPAVEAEEDEDLAEDSKEIDESGLAAFAEIVGARSMADMLEAAAAYATCVESRSQFTRPQLMRRMMASAGGKSVSREDGLRSFGTLLRTGRIEKVTRGHYSLAENSPYLAEARRLT